MGERLDKVRVLKQHQASAVLIAGLDACVVARQGNPFGKAIVSVLWQSDCLVRQREASLAAERI
jgi:hypothetical protein